MNELYDRGSDLVEAAAALRQRAGHRGASAAAPAVLGCLEAALRDLADASAALWTVTGEPPDSTDGSAPARRRQHERMRAGFRNLEVALQDAAGAAAAARSLAARVVHADR